MAWLKLKGETYDVEVDVSIVLVVVVVGC